LATSPPAATLICEIQEERSRLSGTAYGDTKVAIYMGLSIGILHVSVQHFSKNIVITVIECILAIEHACMKCFRIM